MTSYTLTEDEMFTVVAAIRASHGDYCGVNGHTTCDDLKLAEKMEAELGEYR